MRILSLLLVAGVLIAIRQTPAAHAGGQPGPADRLRAVGMALNAGDVDGALAHFAADATVHPVTQGGETFVGTAQIRVWMERLVAGHFHTEFGPNPTVTGHRVVWPSQLWLDAWRNLGVAPAGVVLDVEVNDAGLIHSFGSTLTPETQSRLATTSAAVAVVDRLFAALNAGDLEATVALLTDDVVIEGALGDHINGIAEARAYYSRLISQNLRLQPLTSWVLTGDRVFGVYGLATDPLQAQGIASAETIGDFYLREGKVARIVARFTPNTIARMPPR